VPSNFALEIFDRTDGRDPRWSRSGRGRVISERMDERTFPAATTVRRRPLGRLTAHQPQPPGVRRRASGNIAVVEPSNPHHLAVYIRRAAPRMSRLADRRAGFSAQAGCGAECRGRCYSASPPYRFARLNREWPHGFAGGREASATGSMLDRIRLRRAPRERRRRVKDRDSPVRQGARSMAGSFGYFATRPRS
jgi:hypothetical protein